MSVNKLVKKHSECPDVNVIVVRRPKQHLWSHVLVGPAEGASRCMDVLRRPTEVAQFDV
jgi:hypothetical protein